MSPMSPEGGRGGLYHPLWVKGARGRGWDDIMRGRVSVGDYYIYICVFVDVLAVTVQEGIGRSMGDMGTLFLGRFGQCPHVPE